MANRYMKRCSTSLVIREMQIKTTVSYQLKSIRVPIIKKIRNNKCWWGYMEKSEPLCSQWECNLGTATGEKSMEFPQKMKNRTTTWSSNPTFGYTWEGNEITISERHLHSHIHHSITHNNQDMGTTTVSADR